MGIPSFFQHIIKNYESIFYKLKEVKDTKKKRNLYLDSNSIIYDCLRNLEYNSNNENYNYELYKLVCEKIDSYIELVDADGIVIIAFDGVAPIAKLEQQRTRRNKTVILQELENEIYKKEKTECFNKACITPGTKFMNDLNNYIKGYYNSNKYNCEKIIISGTDNFGEGEHKIFDFIRKNVEYHKRTRTFIYGLDADLIILCLNHLYISNDLYLFREKPEYDNKLNEIYKEELCCFMKISELTEDIVNSMVNINEKNYNEREKINDYILLSFLLGNDFLPHNPTINIRTYGLDILLNGYKEIIKNNETIIENGFINWKKLKKLFDLFCNNEKKYLIEEMKIMKKQERQKNYNRENLTNEELNIKKLNNYPMYNRDSEYYINPLVEGWEERYYEELFYIYTEKNKIKEICKNYLEGLEWTLKYYSKGCVNSVWKYDYHYPPLFSDLVKYMPIFNVELIEENNYKINSITQLCYVLPKTSLNLLPTKIKNYMLENYNYDNCELIHIYCKYLWEAHIDLEEIDIIELNKKILNMI
jgi:5'-3' exonuclease